MVLYTPVVLYCSLGPISYSTGDHMGTRAASRLIVVLWCFSDRAGPIASQKKYVGVIDLSGIDLLAQCFDGYLRYATRHLSSTCEFRVGNTLINQ